ncbi:MAG: hypothetical protein IJA58_07510 [Lachnospiraceae bacterium]|nr:hypothetical protein [Lachnospiraceae bacterium]
MIDKQTMMPFNFLSYGGVITGQQRGMRYRLMRVGEKPDFKLCATVWPGPFAFDATPDEKKTGEAFPYSETGREEAIDWMAEQYESRRDEWDNIPSILEAKL